MKKTSKLVVMTTSLTLVASSLGGLGGYYLATSLSPTSTQENKATLTPVSTKESKNNSSLSQIMDSVVEITTQTQYSGRFREGYTSTGAGSGVIVNNSGYIITNYHVIEGVDQVEVKLTNGNTYTAEVLNVDKTKDLALLKISPTETLTSSSFGNSEDLDVGEYVLAIGNPLGSLGGTVTEGIISAKDREINVGDTIMNLLQTTAAINSGNSGGGLFDSNGLLIGIVNAKTSGVAIEGLGFAIPINDVKEFLENVPYAVNINEV